MYNFDHGVGPKSEFLSTGFGQTYISTVRSYVVEKFITLSSKYFQYERMEPLTIRLLSNPDDHIYDGEYALEPLEDLIKFQQHLNTVLTNSRMQYNYSKTSNQHIPGTAEANPPVFLSVKAASDIETLKKFGDVDATSVYHGVKDFHPDLSNFSLVDDSGNVTVPKKWVPLSPGEEIISAVGHAYNMTCCTWLLSIFTFGCYYLNIARPKVIRRYAYILTTHRIVEIILVQKKGKVPAELGSMDMLIRSYFPKEILSGCIRSAGLYAFSSLLTPHGTITLKIPSDHFIFAQKMQLATSRYPKIPIADFNDLTHRFFAANPKLQEPVQSLTDNAYDEEVNAQNILDYSQRKFLSTKLSPLERILLPLLPREKLLNRFQGGAQYLPSCFGLISMFRDHPNAWHCFSWVSLVKCISCCSLPMVTVNTSVATDHTLFYTMSLKPLQTLKDENNIMEVLSNTGGAGDSRGSLASTLDGVESGNANSGNSSPKRSSTATAESAIGKTQVSSCGSCCGPNSQYHLEPFVVIWTPVNAIRSQEVNIIDIGAKPFAEKLLCCELVSKSFKSQYVMNIETKVGISFPFAENFPFKSWIRDKRLTNFTNTIAAIQTQPHLRAAGDMNV